MNAKFFIVFLLLVSLFGVIHAEDFVTTTISGTTSNHGGANYNIGNSGASNTLIISDAGMLTNVGAFWQGSGATTSISNLVYVTGAGSKLFVAGYYYIANTLGSSNLLLVSEGGQVTVGNLSLSQQNGPPQPYANSVIVTGDGSTLTVAGGEHTIGKYGGPNNSLTISNGGVVIATGGYTRLGGSDSAYYTSSNNLLLVTGNGSILSNKNTLYVGYNTDHNTVIISNQGLVVSSVANVSRSSGTTNNAIIVSAGAILQADTLTSAGAHGNYITNYGGVYRFSTNSPTINSDTTNGIFLNNGWISYIGISDADVYNSQISNITFLGQNTFRLNSSTGGTSQSYVFSNNNNQLFQKLELVNGNSRWQTTNGTTIGPGGLILSSNANSSMGGGLIVSTQATINVYNQQFTVDNIISGSGELNKIGSGKLILNSSNTFSGTISVGGGIVEVKEAGGLSAVELITINSSGTLLLSKSNSDIIKDDAQINMNGGTLELGKDVNDYVGALTLSSDSVLNLCSDPTSRGEIHFSSINNMAGGTILIISNWVDGGNASGGADRIYFGSDPGSIFRSQIQFAGYNQGSYWNSSTLELSPYVIPEPNTIFISIFIIPLIVRSKMLKRR